MSARLTAVGAGLACLLAVGCSAPQPPSAPAPRDRAQHRHLLVVLDGLRPDYVKPALMPNLHALAGRGVVFTDHHAVYPTMTRVNAASISTGAYPERHGLLGNSVFFLRVDATRFLSTADRANLLRIERVEAGRLLTAPTLGERLAGAGLRLLVASAGSSGSSYLLNHTVAGGGIIHYEYALPTILGQAVRQRLGPPPAADLPNRARNRYIVDALLEVGLDRVDPAVAIIWLSDPDATAHARGIGHPTSVAALRAVDAELGRLEAGLRAAGRLETFNIWVTSDHGFSTHTGGVDLDALLAPFAGELPEGTPRIVAGAGRSTCATATRTPWRASSRPCSARIGSGPSSRATAACRARWDSLSRGGTTNAPPTSSTRRHGPTPRTYTATAGRARREARPDTAA